MRLLAGEISCSIKAELLRKRLQLEQALLTLELSEKELQKVGTCLWGINLKIYPREDRKNSQTREVLMGEKLDPNVFLHQIGLMETGIGRMQSPKMSERTRVIREKMEEELKKQGKEMTETVDNGDCWFDAVAQGLSILEKKQWTPKEVRTTLHRYCQEKQSTWLKKALEQEQEPVELATYLKKLPFTFEELDVQDEIGLWGNHRVEGKLLAEALGVNVRVHQGDLVPWDATCEGAPDWVDDKGNRFKFDYVLLETDNSKTIEVVLYPGHYAAVLPLIQ